MAIIRHSQRAHSTKNVEKARLAPILSRFPFGPLLILGNVSSNVTGTFNVGQNTTLKVYGCGGGGNGSAIEDLSGAAGGGGAASQINGFVLTVIPNETLSYSVGAPGQPTIITRSGSTIFSLNGGSGATAGASNPYSSHAGGAGAGGGARYTPGGAAASVVGCAGGGGGGGFGDSSPVQVGRNGGPGGASSAPNSIFAGTPGGGGGAVGTSGTSIPLAQGGTTGGQPYFGGGGGAGGGLTLPSFPETSGLYFGGGGGGQGPYAPGSAKGGPGLLLITDSLFS